MRKVKTIEYAVECAKRLPYVRGQKRVYAVIVDRKGNVLSESANSYTKSHPEQYRCACCVGMPESIFLHAEMAALVKCKDGNPHKIYVARVDSKNKPRLAKPCEICYHAISETEIMSIEHTVG